MAKPFWQITKHGLTIRLRVTPKASHNGVTGLYTNDANEMSLKVSTTAQPEKGKANKAVIAILAKRFKQAKSTFEVIACETSRHKTVLVNGEINDIKPWLLKTLQENTEKD